MDNETIKRGDEYLAKLTSSENTPSWARGLVYILTALIGFILALGLNVGDVVNTYMSNRTQLESTVVSQGGQLEISALSGLIEANRGMTSHISDLIRTISNLVDENNILVDDNAKLMKENFELKTKISEKDKEIERLLLQVQELKIKTEAGTEGTMNGLQ